MIRAVVTFSVRRRVTILMCSLAAIAFGLIGFSKLPINLLPNLSYPTFTIQTEYENAAPAEVEKLVSRPIEEAVGILKGLQKIHSVSRSGVSEVTLEFQWGSNMDSVAMEIREKLDRLRLPQAVNIPAVLRFDPALDPIMKLSLSGDLPLTKLRVFAEEDLKEQLERIDGLASAQILGGEEEEIQVNLNQGKLAVMGITPSAIQQALAESNINRPGGSLKNQQSELLIRTLNEFQSLDDIRTLRISEPSSPIVRLGDVADILWASKDREEITRFDGQEGILISIFKQGDANTVQVAERVKAQIKRLSSALPKESNINVVFDQSRFIANAIDEVKQALMLGGLFAVLVLWLFLRNFQLTAIIITAIPISVITAFIFMYRTDISLNIMSLGGLTLGVGMLVDSAIVVLESIHRHREQGLSVVQATIEGTSKVGGAVLASVLTTIAVFVPIIFVEGIAGQLFRDQSLTVTFSLVASLLVAFTLIPMLASSNRAGNLTLPQTTTKGPINRWYASVLARVLQHRLAVVLSGFMLLALSLLLVPKIPTELIPELSEGEFYFDIELPAGTALPTTNTTVLAMENIARQTPGVAKVYSSVGSRNVNGGLSLKTKDENLAQINIVIDDRSNKVLEQNIIQSLRTAYTQFSNAKIQLGRPSFFSLNTPLELLFFGEDLTQLRDYTLMLLPKIETIEGVTDIQSSLENGNPELKITFDRQKLSQYGFSIEQIAQVLGTRVDGTIATQFQLPDRLVDIRLRNRELDRDSYTDIENIVVGEANGRTIYLRALATIDEVKGPAAIDRLQQARTAIIAGNIKGRSMTAINEDISTIIAANPPPSGITYQIDGQAKEMKRSFASLQFAIALAVFLVYLVMAATFEHLLHPLIILFSIPMALIGVIIGLYSTGYGISVIALIGMVFLIGIVVNNAIVLVDAINQERRSGTAKTLAITTACQSRLRPILMTTCTTVLGLLPMAIGLGEGAELRAPLAIVVSFGLMVSTLLTLFIIPAIYSLLPSNVIKDDVQAALDQALLDAELQEQSAQA